MKNNLTKSKVWQIIGIAVLCAVCILTAVLGIVFGMNHSSEDLNVSKDMSEKPDDSVVIETTGEQGIKLTSGVATTAADGTVTKTITATVTPSNATDKSVDWSLSFKNSSSAWAMGKNLSDYVTIAPISDGSLTATLTCKQAFAEQIIITCSSRENSVFQATATVDYERKIEDISLSIFKSKDKITADNPGTVVSAIDIYNKSNSCYYKFVPTVKLSDVYTIDKKYDASAKMYFYYGNGSFYQHFKKNHNKYIVNSSTQNDYSSGFTDANGNFNTGKDSFYFSLHMICNNFFTNEYYHDAIGLMQGQIQSLCQAALKDCGTNNKLVSVECSAGDFKKTIIVPIGIVDFSTAVTGVSLSSPTIFF